MGILQITPEADPGATATPVELQMLSRALALLSQSHDPEALGKAVLKIITEVLGFACGDLAYLESDGTLQITHRERCHRPCPLLNGPFALLDRVFGQPGALWQEDGVAIAVDGQTALVLHGKSHFPKATVEAMLQALVFPLAASLRNARLYLRLQRQESQRQALVHALLRAQEDERLRVSRELHDEVGQGLTSLSLGLYALERSPSRERIKMLHEMTKLLLEDVRRIARNLRPSALDHLGLEPALVRYLEEFGERTGLTMDYSINLGGRLPPEYETVLYRVAQEALTNIARHSQASRVSLVLVANCEEISLAVEDNGKGFDPNATEFNLGLCGMRERLELLGGTLLIESAPEQGTTLFARLPRPQEQP